MTFRAKLRRGFPIWTAWRHRHAPAGEVAGVAFHWTQGNDYATGDLTAIEVGRLHGNVDVVLECFGAEPAPAGGAVTAPVAPVAEAAASDAPVRGSPAWREREALRVKEWRRQQRQGRK